MSSYSHNCRTLFVAMVAALLMSGAAAQTPQIDVPPVQREVCRVVFDESELPTTYKIASVNGKQKQVPCAAGDPMLIMAVGNEEVALLLAARYCDPVALVMVPSRGGPAAVCRYRGKK